MAELDPGVLQSVINSNFKTISEAQAAGIASAAQAYAQVAALQAQNAAAAQQHMQAIMQASTAKLVDGIGQMDIGEAGAINKVATGNDLAAMLSQLLTALNSGQQGVKSAGTTPPVTVEGVQGP